MFVFVISSCATQQIPEVKLQVDAHQLKLAEQKSWLLKGKIGFKNNTKKQSANLRWQQSFSEYQLNLTTIIGTSILKMSGSDQFSTLITDDGTYKDTNASKLISRITGWELPVESLQFWVKGQYGVNDQITLSEQGWVTQLIPDCTHCANWIIDYDDYQIVKDIWLPHKITLNNQSNNSQLLIKVNTWSLK
ncbi:MAG: lipoprotein insertase outer membrane protein LolB [Paraglaciecola sp.]|uniref:lipoprotein insertase outer membrane protein LolB n=1 Tax=Paraglaciecola sp. TaxID=1920173 RepID=UPI0032679B82